MESDLQRYQHTDYRDRWRVAADGVRLLTLRRMLVLIRHLPADSAITVALGGSGWTRGDYLLADVFHATAGQAHPDRPKPVKGFDPARDKRVRQAKARAHERQRAIDAGEIT